MSPAKRGIESAKAKLRRAMDHIQSAKEVSNEFIDTDFYSVVTEHDREGHLVARVTDVKPFPAHFGLLIGDAVHNFRSSLDHIAFGFSNPTMEQVDKVGFPLFSK